MQVSRGRDAQYTAYAVACAWRRGGGERFDCGDEVAHDVADAGAFGEDNARLFQDVRFEPGGKNGLAHKVCNVEADGVLVVVIERNFDAEVFERGAVVEAAEEAKEFPREAGTVSEGQEGGVTIHPHEVIWRHFNESLRGEWGQVEAGFFEDVNDAAAAEFAV